MKNGFTFVEVSTCGTDDVPANLSEFDVIGCDDPFFEPIIVFWCLELSNESAKESEIRSKYCDVAKTKQWNGEKRKENSFVL